MANNERVQVALFIDWDNLAISTAADLGGAVPDVKAIVQRTQQFGTVVIAKAYAEWQATSDRLAIYRAGVEPVYAPTFRFEPDTATQAGKGKSLADPCMVADCVDALHLFPDINTYVLVTGDKDMIPVVRLAQLRGRRVIVIGPDYVAGVLREMADEFIAYRSLVEGTPAPRPPETRRYPATRHQPASFTRQEKLAAPVTPQTPVQRPKPAETKPVIEPEEPAAAPSEERAPAAIEDPRAVFSVIQEILRQRLDEGRERIRATNLKDALMQRMPGFSERKLGFAKFKDLLRGAEKAGLIQVIAAGPVHWITLPSIAQPTTSAAPEATPVEPVAAPEIPEPQLESQRDEMIRHIYELRERSRWLTYTYVLTNLISHYAKTLPQAQAENQARAMLNYLVQEGILRVDKEPQEVEVGGLRHRVRMCHLNVEHESVTRILGFQPAESEEPPLSLPDEESAVTGLRGQEQIGRLSEEFGAAEPAAHEELAQAESEPTGNGARADAGESAVEESAVIAEAPAEEEPVAQSSAIAELPATPAEEESAAQAGDTAARETQTGRAAKLERAYEALRQVLQNETSASKPMVSAGNLRASLVRALRGFNERELGFARFKEFLASAEEAGVVHTKTRGHVTLVGPVGAEAV